MLFAGLMTALSGVFIIGKASMQTLRRILGYDTWVDTLTFVGLFLIGGTATYSALMTIVYTGISVSVILWSAKKIYGAERYQVGKGWVETREGHPVSYWVGYWVGQATHGMIAKAIESFKAGQASTVEEVKA